MLNLILKQLTSIPAERKAKQSKNYKKPKLRLQQKCSTTTPNNRNAPDSLDCLLQVVADHRETMTVHLYSRSLCLPYTCCHSSGLRQNLGHVALMSCVALSAAESYTSMYWSNYSTVDTNTYKLLSKQTNGLFN
jgi:hypothetical protein